MGPASRCPPQDTTPIHQPHKPQVNPNLADWFKKDPVERIVNLEGAIISRKREMEKERLGLETRSPSPGIRFEDEEVKQLFV